MDNTPSDPAIETIGTVVANPEVEQQVTVAPVTTPPPRPKRIPRIAVFILPLIAFVVLAAAGGILAYEKFFMTPERVLGQMVQNITKVDSYHFELNVTAAASPSEDFDLMDLFTASGFTLEIEGDTNLSDPDSPKGRADISASYAGISMGPLNTITTGTDVYVRLAQIPFFLSELGSNDIDKIENKWILLNPEGIQEYFDVSVAKDAVPQTVSTTSEFFELFSKHPNLVTLTQEEGATLHDQDMYIYSFEVNKDELVKVLVDSGILDQYEQSGVDKSEIEKMLQEMMDDISIGESKLWIGKRDLLPHRIAISLVLEGSLNSTIGIGLDLSQYNTTATIEPPDDYLMFDQAIELLGFDQQARDSQRRSDLYAITNAIYQYAAEHNGNLPGETSFPIVETCIGSSSECFDLANAGEDTIVPTYIAQIPIDPTVGTKENTGYMISMDENGRVVATAPSSEAVESPITVTR
ncbi:hypothetical protein A2801_02350 [Candidatus Woesebacteria bacterium RIFCSPHIGHO2_01_FULL_41_10]|uniref:Uncharacterized protein n=1 Tax=Candidatus Woesebacteria bacterium RIFCSPHIGHO2_01_FULL_41_10 TaxID=1802500 RepID=A0A1F7YPC1_9BACT|nr:MAG: hypothetical protein A2801_02350 [Candidatus Woesebacteria bacterium RIFCSPHIGHO2_01_FULL_41_10]